MIMEATQESNAEDTEVFSALIRFSECSLMLLGPY